jgi:hypothetical protein
LNLKIKADLAPGSRVENRNLFKKMSEFILKTCGKMDLDHKTPYQKKLLTGG